MLKSNNFIESVLVSGLTSGIVASLITQLNINTGDGAAFADKLKESALSNITSTAIQSAINGDSFTESLKHQAINTIVMAGANYAANQIGGAYHTGEINKATQLTLHAGLGAITNALTGNDALSGAIAGVSGEVFAELLGNSLYGTTSGSELNQYQQTVLKEYGGLAAGISSLITGKVQDLDVSDIRDNVYAGYRVGKNAAENNYLLPQEKGNLIKELENCKGDSICKTQVQEKYEKISEPRDEEFKKEMIECAVGRCEEFNKIHYDLRMQLTEEGNEYYKTHKDEFKQLPDSESVFHTFQQDKNGNVINVTSGAEEGYTKFVHPIYGYEVVLDGNGNIVTNPLNAGTYNFYNPYNGIDNNLIEDKDDFFNKNFGNHKKYDVDPYFLEGNSQNDPSSMSDRYFRIFYSINKKLSGN